MGTAKKTFAVEKWHSASKREVLLPQFGQCRHPLACDDLAADRDMGRNLYCNSNRSRFEHGKPASWVRCAQSEGLGLRNKARRVQHRCLPKRWDHTAAPALVPALSTRHLQNHTRVRHRAISPSNKTEPGCPSSSKLPKGHCRSRCKVERLGTTEHCRNRQGKHLPLHASTSPSFDSQVSQHAWRLMVKW